MAVQSIKPQSPTSVISYDAVTIQQHHTEPIYSLMIQHGLMSPPTQYSLSGRQVLQVKKPNQQYQSTEGTKIQ